MTERPRLVGVLVGLMVAGNVLAAEQAVPEPDALPPQRAEEQPAMDLTRLGEVLRAVAPGVRGKDGFWEAVITGVKVTVMADQQHNRMRVLAPAADADQVEPQVLRRMLEANFTSALDARYAIFRGVVWAAFLHPLDSLTERDLRSALEQVVTLVKTTGTTYSSSGLTFGGPQY